MKKVLFGALVAFAWSIPTSSFGLDDKPTPSSDACKCLCETKHGEISENIIFIGRACRPDEDKDACTTSKGVEGKKMGCKTTSQPLPPKPFRPQTPLDTLNQLMAPIE